MADVNDLSMANFEPPQQPFSQAAFKGLVSLSVLLAALAATPAAAHSPPPDGYIAMTLSNGLQVSILPDPAHPIVATQIWYHVGSANEEPKTRGFAHLFEHMMFGGTAENPKQSYWDLHERWGGDNNAYTSFDETVYVSEIPRGGFERVLELEADRMVHLDLNEENLDNEKRIVTEELRVATENDPMSRLFTKALETLLSGHPYALTPAGTKEDIAAATLEHAAEFYEKYYRPKNAHLVIVGPVDGPAVLDTVRRLFGSLPADGISPPDPPPLHGWSLPAETELEEDLPPVEVSVLVFTLPPADSPDRWALEVLGEILAGGSVDPVEEILVRRRRKALIAGVETVTARRGGAVALYAASLPYRRRATAFRHLEEARDEMARLEWLDEPSLDAAKRRLQMRELTAVYWAASRADDIGRARWWLGDERLAFEAAAMIERVSLQEVRGVFRKYLLEPSPVRIHVRPERVPFLVRLFGWLYPLVGG